MSSFPGKQEGNEENKFAAKQLGLPVEIEMLIKVAQLDFQGVTPHKFEN